MRVVISQAWLISKSAEGQVGAAGVFQVADQFLGATAFALDGFKVGDVRIGLIGDECLEPAPVDVGERQLGAGVGNLAAHDHPCRCRPAGQVDHGGDLGESASSRKSMPSAVIAGTPARSGIAKHVVRMVSVGS